MSATIIYLRPGKRGTHRPINLIETPILAFWRDLCRHCRALGIPEPTIGNAKIAYEAAMLAAVNAVKTQSAIK